MRGVYILLAIGVKGGVLACPTQIAGVAAVRC